MLLPWHSCISCFPNLCPHLGLLKDAISRLRCITSPLYLIMPVNNLKLVNSQTTGLPCMK